jgi:hypothetical protein
MAAPSLVPAGVPSREEQHPGEPEAEACMNSQLVDYLLMVVFFGIIGIIPTLWFLVGLKTYGTGDYHQP